MTKKFTILITTLEMFSLNRIKILLLLITLMTVAIVFEVAVYNVGLISSDYYEILGKKDQHRFVWQTVRSIALIFAISILKSLKTYLASLLHVSWRKYCTDKIHEQYFQYYNYYRLNVLKTKTSTLDNVDQRITQDVDRMFQMLSLILPELLVWPFIVSFYWYKSQIETGWLGPISCIILFILSSIINTILIQNISPIVYQQKQCEGDFRYKHVHIRNNAESIAFINCGNDGKQEQAEKYKCNQLLNSLIIIQLRLIFRQFILLFTTTIADYFGSIISFIAIAIPIFAGNYDSLTPQELSKLISANAFVTIYLINCFTRLIDLSQNISIFIGNYNRINELNQWFHSSSHFDNTSDEFTDVNIDDESNNSENFYEMKNVTIRSPLDQHLILENLNLKIKPHVNIIITGSSGSGKTSILRTLKGIWSISSGSLYCNSQQLKHENDVMFFTHKPLLSNGSIAEQILYPKIYEQNQWIDNNQFRQRILDIMKFLDLEDSVLKRVNYDIHYNYSDNWLDTLSIGEAQRFQIARIFFHQPKIIFLDESLSSIPIDMEEKILNELINRYSTTIVCCSHRHNLKLNPQIELHLINSKKFSINHQFQ